MTRFAEQRCYNDAIKLPHSSNVVTKTNSGQEGEDDIDLLTTYQLNHKPVPQIQVNVELTGLSLLVEVNK